MVQIIPAHRIMLGIKLGIGFVPLCNKGCLAPFGDPIFIDKSH